VNGLFLGVEQFQIPDQAAIHILNLEYVFCEPIRTAFPPILDYVFFDAELIGKVFENVLIHMLSPVFQVADGIQTRLEPTVVSLVPVSVPHHDQGGPVVGGDEPIIIGLDLKDFNVVGPLDSGPGAGRGTGSH
jgi:hypothetical protein